MWCLETLKTINNSNAKDAYEAYKAAGIKTAKPGLIAGLNTNKECRQVDTAESKEFLYDLIAARR